MPNMDSDLRMHTLCVRVQTHTQEKESNTRQMYTDVGLYFRQEMV